LPKTKKPTLNPGVGFATCFPTPALPGSGSMGLPPRAESQPRKAPQTNLPMKLSIERTSATTTRMRVGILDLESRSLQAVLIINLAAVQQIHAHGVDDDFHAVLR